MSKQRKTRKDKERLQRRRQEASTVAEGGTTAYPDETLSDTPTGQKPGEWSDDHVMARRIRLMRYSLIVFALLVVFQLTIWGLLNASLLPADWTEMLLG